MLDLRVNAQSTWHTQHILPYLKKFLLADYAQSFLPRTSLILDCRVLPYVAGLYYVRLYALWCCMYCCVLRILAEV